MPFSWSARPSPVLAGTSALRRVASAPVLALTGPGPTLADHTGADPGAVAGARAAVAAEAGVAVGRLLFARQVHGAGVVVVDGPWEGPPPEADALVTARPDLVLGVLVADCAPVLLADPVAGLVGVAHAGRRGMDAGVVLAAVSALRDLGARDLVAVVGPSVCARCYEVPAALRDDVASRHRLTASLTWTGTPSLDVTAGVLDQLTGAGVPVTALAGCTLERPDLGSVRRQGPGAPRWAGLAWLEAVPHPVPHPVPEPARRPVPQPAPQR